MIASKQDSTVSTPYRSNSSPSRRAPIRQAEHSASRSAASDSGIRELRVMIDERRPVGHAGVPEPDRRDHQALLEDAGGVAGHRAGHGAADVVVVAEGLHERDHPCPAGEDRHRDAQVGQVPDAALGAVDVVVEEDVALAHLLDREVAGDRVHERGVRAAGELAQQPVVDAGAEVVGVADHRAAAGARRSRSRPPSPRWPASPGRSRPAPGRRSRRRRRSGGRTGTAVGARAAHAVAPPRPGHDDVEVVVDRGP